MPCTQILWKTVRQSLVSSTSRSLCHLRECRQILNPIPFLRLAIQRHPVALPHPRLPTGYTHSVARVGANIYIYIYIYISLSRDPVGLLSPPRISARTSSSNRAQNKVYHADLPHRYLGNILPGRKTSSKNCGRHGATRQMISRSSFMTRKYLGFISQGRIENTGCAV